MIVTLYQGNVKCATMWPLPSLGFRNVQTQQVVQYKVDADPEEAQVYFKLSKKAIPDSVLCFETGQSVKPYTLMSPLNESPEVLNYRLMKGYDSSLNIYFSDGVRGKIYENNPVSVFFLEATFNKYKNVQRLKYRVTR